MNNWIQTYTGREFYFGNHGPADFDILDIAHSLSNLCRFNGHTRTFYSVAEHSVRVLHYVRDRRESEWAKKFHDQVRRSPHLEAWALLHDAAEAYLGDVTKPLKELMTVKTRVEGFGWVPADYSDAEKQYQRKIGERFGLPEPGHKDCPLGYIGYHDYHMLAAEARDLLSEATVARWVDVGMASSIPTIEPWSPEEARRRFLDEAAKLGLMDPADHLQQTTKKVGEVSGASPRLHPCCGVQPEYKTENGGHGTPLDVLVCPKCGTRTRGCWGRDEADEAWQKRFDVGRDLPLASPEARP